MVPNHIRTWKQITSDTWILKSISGATIEHHKINLTDTERMLFRKEIKWLSDLGVIHQVKNQDPSLTYELSG